MDSADGQTDRQNHGKVSQVLQVLRGCRCFCTTKKPIESAAILPSSEKRCNARQPAHRPAPIGTGGQTRSSILSTSSPLVHLHNVTRNALSTPRGIDPRGPLHS